MRTLQIDPVALHIGPLQVHWYGLMYALSFVMIWSLANYRAKKPNSSWNPQQISDLVFYGALGAIIGGRIGYMLFYDFFSLVAQPWITFKIWQGGMSFHGGVVGVLIAIGLYSKKNHKPFFAVLDFIAPLVPTGLAAGRIGNLINGELWGRVTHVPWAMVFPHADNLPRHPSQLYEFLLEGVVLFVILWLYSSRPRPIKATSGLFAVLYASFRFTLEFLRQPDLQLGFIAWGWLTMGQLLSLPLLIAGAFCLYQAYRDQEYLTIHSD